jgi:hypothetical protein
MRESEDDEKAPRSIFEDRFEPTGIRRKFTRRTQRPDRPRKVFCKACGSQEHSTRSCKLGK